MLFTAKSMEDLMTSSLTRLRQTPITETGPGGIARLFLAIVNEKLAEIHANMNTALMSTMISHANAEALDALGAIVNCERRLDEIDDNYRYRIVNQIHAAATANQSAIRMAALSVDGVKDIIIKKYIRGTGSFGVYLVTDEPTPSDAMIQAVEAAILPVIAEGVRVEIFKPVLLPVEITIKVYIDKRASEADKKSILTNGTYELREYINSRNVGESIDIIDIKNLIQETHSLTLGHEVLVLRIQDSPRLWTHQHAAWNERFIESTKPNSIMLV